MGENRDTLSDAAAVSAVEAGKQEGKAFGRYRLLRKLGKGGMGVVFEAEDTKLRRLVAIKILPKDVAADPVRLERLLTEARANARLQHPNTVAVYDIAELEGFHFIAMELIRGQSAEQLLRGRGLPWREATRIVADTCRGLVAAHAAGVVHRDIKPANILCREDGVSKLADFGLAKFAEGSNASLTGMGRVIGTPQFMSPEQCDGDRVDALSDVYSLGATYFTLLVGRPPYEADRPLQVMYAHRNKPVPDPQEAEPTVPQSCAAIVRRAMAKAPSDRYPSAEAMLSELETALSSSADESTRVEASVQPATAAEPTPVSLPSVVDPQPIAQPTTGAAARSARSRQAFRVPLAIAAAAISMIVLWLVYQSWTVEPAVSPDGASDDWQPLFNGRDLTGWSASSGTASQWSVENSELVGRGANTFFFTDRASYGDFHCRATMTLSPNANSGLLFRSDDYSGYPNTYEAQLGWRGTESDFGNLYCNFDGGHDNILVPAQRRPVVAPDKPFTLEVIAEGPRIQILVDGELLNDHTESSSTRLRRGRIGLQSFSAETVVRVSRIEIRELAP